MFIYHFHRIIRHRVIWAGFAIITALTFLSVDQCYSGSGDADRVATIGGRGVSRQTYAAMERELRGLGRNRDSGLPAAVVASQIWQRVAALQVADGLGLATTRGEINAEVHNYPAFSPQGAFDRNVYRRLLREQLGLDESQFEANLSEDLALRKLRALVGSAAWVAPLEVNDELAAWTDEFAVRSAVLSNRFLDASLPLDDAALQAYYDAHRQAFALPDRVAVRYVALAVSNFLGRVTVPEQDAKDYYDDHTDRFTRPGPSNTVATLTYAEARTQIVAILRHDLARQAATVDLSGAFLEHAASNGFAAAAAAWGLPVQATPLFAKDDEIPGIAGPREFCEAAFDLDPSQREGRFGVARGADEVYALAAWTNSPAHQPSFAECAERVRPRALDKARADAFQKKAEATRADLLQALQAGKAFDAAARGLGLNVSTSVAFTAHSSVRFPAFEHGAAVIQAAMHLRPGDLSEPQVLDDGEGAVYVHVEARRTGDALAAEVLRSQVREGLARGRLNAMLAAWMEGNVGRLGLKISPKFAGELAASAPSPEESPEE